MSESIPPPNVTSCQKELTCGTRAEGVCFIKLALPPWLKMIAVEYRINRVEKRQVAPDVLDLEKSVVLGT